MDAIITIIQGFEWLRSPKNGGLPSAGLKSGDGCSLRDDTRDRIGRVPRVTPDLHNGLLGYRRDNGDTGAAGISALITEHDGSTRGTAKTGIRAYKRPQSIQDGLMFLLQPRRRLRATGSQHSTAARHNSPETHLRFAEVRPLRLGNLPKPEANVQAPSITARTYSSDPTQARGRTTLNAFQSSPAATHPSRLRQGSVNANTNASASSSLHGSLAPQPVVAATMNSDMHMDLHRDLQHMESNADPRDGHVERLEQNLQNLDPSRNLHQQLPPAGHRRRQSSHEHGLGHELVLDLDFDTDTDLDRDSDHRFDLRHQQQHQQQLQLQHQHQLQDHRRFDLDLDLDLDHDHDDTPPGAIHHDDRYALPPAAFVATNLDSVSSNAQHAFAPVNPDDFYQSYRALHFNSNPDTLPMAASVPRPSLRSNGDGTTPKHPVVSSNRNLARSNLRSASNPVDNRPTAVGGNGASSSIPRAPVHLGTATRVKRDPPTSAHPRNGNGAPSYSTLRSSITQDSPDETSRSTTSPRAQRAKFVTEDQVSSNSQSFASRIGKPRTPATSGNPNSSKSMTNLRPNSPPQPQSTSNPTHPRAQGLLFGEILPEQHHLSSAGYGIEGLRPRRTSESGLEHPWAHQRSLSDPDVEPASPSSWYRNLNGDTLGEDAQQDSIPKGHSRSQSDVPTSTSALPVRHKPATRKPPSSNASTPGSASKLPLSVRKLSSPTSSSSPPSTRSNSPSTLKRPHLNGRTSRTATPTTRAKTPTARAKTPTQTALGRKQPPRTLVTPSNNNRLQANIIAPLPKLSPPLRSSRPRQPVSMASTASSRMKAVERGKSPSSISRPPTRIAEPTTTRRRKISVGPIDFEQRREHIRLAYTKSIRESQALEARQQAADRRRREMEAAARAKHKAAAAAAIAAGLTPSPEPYASNASDDIPDVPPIPDVSAIPDAHSNVLSSSGVQKASEDSDTPHIHEIPSISDTPTDIPDTAVFQDEAESPVLPRAPEVALAREGDSEKEDHGFLETPSEIMVPSPAESILDATQLSVALPPDYLTAAARQTPERPVADDSVGDFDSPTLGLPGSFPALSPPAATEDRPWTAISATSETTEFDNEEQTNPPVQAHSPLEVPITLVNPPSPRESPSRPKIEYQYPFMDEPDSPEQPQTSQDTVRDGNLSEQPEIESPIIPGAFNNDLDMDYESQPSIQPPFETTITIRPPPDDETSNERSERTIPFPRMEVDYESDCHEDLDNQPGVESHNAHHDEDTATDACTEGTDDRDDTKYRFESQYEDQVSSHRASTCESTDVDPLDEPDYPSYDEQETPDASRSLAVPTLPATNRTSQQSAWTDFSFESGDLSDATRSPGLQNDDDNSSLGHATIFETRSIHRDSRSTSRPQDSHYSQSELRPSIDSSRSMNYFNHLPELDTGDGFSIPYLSQRSSRTYSYVPSPMHEPPPVPTPPSGSACNSQRTSGVFYDQSQYASTFINSERGSEDLQATATPQSMDAASMETPDQYFPGSTVVNGDVKPDAYDKNTPAGKEKHRLVQRRNVLRELFDTEAVFVRDMNIIEEIYKGTAEACPRLDNKTVKLIFRNTDEIIEFHTTFLSQVKEAVASVYTPQSRRSVLSRDDSFMSEPGQFNAGTLDDAKDRITAVGPVFQKNLDKMKLVHEGFLRNSDQAAKRLIEIQQDPTVKVWLNECNEVAKDLTAAWDLDSLLIKPMQRITKYPNLIVTLLQHTPKDHPDREALLAAKDTLETAIIEINKTKKNFELVGQIVGRKRKESDVKAGFARAFGKRVDKLQASGNRPTEDPEYAKLNEKFGDDYLRLQVVLRDVEFYTRQVSAYVHEFLQYLSSIELVMRLQPGNYPELESKWVQFNISIRDLEKVALEEHLSQVRKHVIEPFELVIKAYGNPSLAMKKRQKRRVDFERNEQLKRGGKSADAKLKELVEQYDALNDTLLKELPQLSALTEKIGNICLGNFVNIQTKWYGIWKEKMKVVLGDCPDMPDLKEVVSTFQRDYPYAQEQMSNIGILNPAYRGRMSQSTTVSVDESLLKVRSRPSDIDARGRGLSLNGDQAPTLPAPDFIKRNSGSFNMSPTSTGAGAMPSPHQYYYRDYYSGIGGHQQGTASPLSPDVPGSSRSFAASTRPSTGRSFDSGVIPRQSSESSTQLPRDSNTTYSSNYPSQESRRFSGLFHSALPLPDGPEESQRSSRASSRERAPATDGYNVLWLAASLFEFNIATTKHEAGYPYLVYQAGEIFDVIAEKGELWLAKNQDDLTDSVGWIWSKHFAKLADS
ncbi:hypothetical protein G7046_g1968 [Stylonectria norvegica]|nr:hypothetical protein G7046_g1968 [Stylonectria norvegica]